MGETQPRPELFSFAGLRTVSRDVGRDLLCTAGGELTSGSDLLPKSENEFPKPGREQMRPRAREKDARRRAPEGAREKG